MKCKKRALKTRKNRLISGAQARAAGVFIITLFVFVCSAFLTPSLFAQENKDRDEIRKELEAVRARMDELEKRLAEKDTKEQGAVPLGLFWDRGLCFESENGEFSAKISGKVHVDGAYISGTRKLDRFLERHGDDLDDGVDFRRARLTFKGTLYDRFVYKASYDFSEDDIHYKDLYLGIKELPGGILLRIGRFKEPFGLEGLTCAPGLKFLERSLVRSLYPYRNIGAALSGSAYYSRMTWSAGLFHNTDSFGSDENGGDISATARVSCLLWTDKEDERLFHTGVSYSRRGEDDILLQAGPETQMAPDFIDTDGFPDDELSPHLIDMDAADLFGGESAFCWGPFSAQSEYVRMDVDRPGGTDPTLWGFYVNSGFFLTGEHRPYSRETGTFDRVVPISGFLSEDNGPGAWEITARYSRLVLDDTGVFYGSELSNYTAGLNWYLNSRVSFSANYIHSHLEHRGTARMFLFRFAMDF